MKNNIERMNPIFFVTRYDLREWFKKNHDKEIELSVGYYKVGTGKPSITWVESVEEALCYGWIDGIGHSIDSESYRVRFTPRRPRSNWSAVNIKKVNELIQAGLMQPAGLLAFGKRKPDKSGIYSHENHPGELTQAFEKEFKSNKKAWEFFQSLRPSYRKSAIAWIMSAKQEPTKIKRLNELILNSENECKIKQLSYSPKKQ